MCSLQESARAHHLSGALAAKIVEVKKSVLCDWRGPDTDFLCRAQVDHSFFACYFRNTVNWLEYYGGIMHDAHLMQLHGDVVQKDLDQLFLKDSKLVVVNHMLL